MEVRIKMKAKGNKSVEGKKILTLLLLVGTLMIATTGATYAYFALTATNAGTVTGTAATHTLTLTVTEAALKSGNSGVMVPQLDGAPLASAMNSTNKCVDANTNIVCKVYTITVTNTSTAKVTVNGTIEFTTTTANLKWKRVTSTTAAGSSTTGSFTTKDATSTRTDLTSGAACTPSASSAGCTSVALNKTNGSATYYIIVWIDEKNAEQADTGTWVATITFEGTDGRGITSTIRS